MHQGDPCCVIDSRYICLEQVLHLNIYIKCIAICKGFLIMIYSHLAQIFVVRHNGIQKVVAVKQSTACFSFFIYQQRCDEQRAQMLVVSALKSRCATEWYEISSWLPVAPFSNAFSRKGLALPPRNKSVCVYDIKMCIIQKDAKEKKKVER